MFIDEVAIEVYAGTGGDGLVSYRRELKVQYGGPFGGNGGKGASIIFKGDEGKNTLIDFKYKRIIKAENGEKGKIKGMHGASAKDLIIKVPIGTILYDENKNFIDEILEHDKEIIVAKGGRGGRGNMAFATGYNKCPDFAEKGEPGEYRKLKLELKYLADCGLVGFPSVGKSSLISVISSARPKIASYHFTTLNPSLGVVMVDDEDSFVIADLPGIIKGASSGLGLGFKFLKHIERCKVLVHVLDMSQSDGRCVVDDYHSINEELKSYDLNLLQRPCIVVANKMDIDGSYDNLERFKKETGINDIIEISTITKKNLDILKYKINDLIKNNKFIDLNLNKKENHVNYIFKDPNAFEIEVINNIYYIKGEKIEKLYKMTDFNNESAILRFARQLKGLGVEQKLKDKGIKDRDTVRIYDYEFEFLD